MRNLSYVTLLILAVCCSACYSYRIPKEYRKLENQNAKRKAYVINTSLKKEYNVLSKSQLFIIVNDSAKADLKIKLYPIEKGTECGEGTILSIMTIGQMPVLFRDYYSFRFDEIEKEIITERKLPFVLYQRVWFWDMFSFNKRLDEKLGKMVLGTYQAGMP